MIGQIQVSKNKILAKCGFKTLRFNPPIGRIGYNLLEYKNKEIQLSGSAQPIEFDDSDIAMETMSSLTLKNFYISNLFHNIDVENQNHYKRFRENYNHIDEMTNQISSMDVINFNMINEIDSNINISDFRKTSITKREIRNDFESHYTYLVLPNFYHRIQKDQDKIKLILKHDPDKNDNILFLKY